MRWTPFLLCLLLTGSAAFAQAPAPATPAGEPFAPLRFLVGDWVTDDGSGHFEVTEEVQKSVLVRRNHSESPAANGRPASVHNDLMVIYREGSPAATKAIYFDSEGHVIRYAVESAAAGTATFVSEIVPGAPRFRLSYQSLADGRLAGKFEIAPPGKPDAFAKYLEWVTKRKQR